MGQFFKPQFNLQFFNGGFRILMNPQMTKLLMEAIKEQGERFNCTMETIIPFKAAEAMRDLCNRSSDFFLRNLGNQLEETLEELREKRLAYEARQSHNYEYEDDLPEEDLDTPPSYGKRLR